jgi:hypothetical protein
MFWWLYLAHLLSDYPFQPTWMVTNKARWSVLLLHSGVHFVTSFVLIGQVRYLVWPYLLLLTAIHFTIDLLKNAVNRSRPDWIILPYLVDQGLHAISIFLVGLLITQQVSPTFLPGKSLGLILAIAYLLGTYVWYITERVISLKQPEYRQEVIELAWTRMLIRTGLLTAFLVTYGMFYQLGLTFVFRNPYSLAKTGIRALLTDLSVTVFCSLFVLIVI